MAGANTAAITEPMRARVLTCDGPTSIPARLDYQPTVDPYAAMLEFPDQPGSDGNPVVWMFARDLLAAGLTGQAGVGDVRVSTVEGRYVSCLLIDPEGPRAAAVWLPWTSVQRFCARSYRLVPQKHEWRLLGPLMDAAVAKILGGGS